jgi:hypothetical protein
VKRCDGCGRPAIFARLGSSCPAGDGDDFHQTWAETEFPKETGGGRASVGSTPSRHQTEGD